MKIAVFYRDAFQSGGVPREIEQMVRTLSVRHTVFCWGRSGTHQVSDQSGIQYQGCKELASRLPGWFSHHQPDLVLLVGFFMQDNLIVARIARRYRIPIILNPLAQLTDAVMGGKIFTQDPDVRHLEENRFYLPNVREKLMVLANPFLKKTWLHSVGKMLVEQCDWIAVFSDYEAKQFQKYCTFPENRFIHLRWGLDESTLQEHDQRHYYRDVLGYQDDRSNFVYWGRMDWHHKGIDRLLNGVLHAFQDHSGELPFRVFLMGPDYHGGARKIQNFIDQHILHDVVHLMLPGQYPSGSKVPLRDACASIYLSRWDGFPRTLRESSGLGVPVLVSEETHFSGLVKQFETGLVSEDADDPYEMADLLIHLSHTVNQKQFRLNAQHLFSELSWESCVQDVQKLFEQDSQPLRQREGIV